MQLKNWTFSAAALAATTLMATETKPLHKLDQAELKARLLADSKAVLVQRNGLRNVAAFMNSRADLFPTNAVKEVRLLRREEKGVVWSTWQRFLDLQLALESLERAHSGYLRLRGQPKEESYVIGHTAMLARYRAALELIERMEMNPEFHKVLNDPVPELGLPGDTYSKLKFKFLNAGTGTEFAAREVILQTFSGERLPELRQAARDDARYVWQAGKGRGELLTIKNAAKIVQDGASSAWLPIQTGVSEWMGDTKVYRQDRSLISPEQVAKLQSTLQPGDVLLERREWYVSNVGLPGFWSHAALYVGTPEERRAYFGDGNVRAWVAVQGESSGDIEKLVIAKCARPDRPTLKSDDHPVRIIEAISEGVSLTSLEHTADCDSIAVLRPRLPKTEKAQALLRAFHYVGRPYDFNFDFSTDAELVCTELIYKSYEPARDFKGLTFPLVEMLGRQVTPANEIARQFDAQEGKPEQQFDLILFLDGHERKKVAIASSLAEFRKSWQRPKWHVLVQKSTR